VPVKYTTEPPGQQPGGGGGGVSEGRRPERGGPGDFAALGGAAIVVLVRRVRLMGVHAMQMVIFIGLSRQVYTRAATDPRSGRIAFSRQRYAAKVFSPGAS